MKKLKIILILPLLIFGIKVRSQNFKIDLPYNSKLRKIEYQKVIEFKKLTANELYDKANEWFSYAFISGKHVIDYKNPELNKIIGKGYLPFKFFSRGEQSIEFLIKIETKENKLRYTITNCIYHQSESLTLGDINLEKDSWQVENYPKGWGFKKKFYIKFDKQVKSLITSLKKFMITNPDNDW